MVYFIFCNLGKLYDKTEFIKEKMNFEIDKDGIKSIFKKGKAETKWFIIEEIWESKDFIYLMQSKFAYTVIPKRAFKNDYDIVRLQQFYKEQNEKGKYINIK